MTRRADVLRLVIEHGRDCPIVFTTGHSCREAYAIEDRPNHLYMTGSMGMAPVLGVAIARQTALSTIVVDGDGAILMNPAAMLVAVQYMPDNLLHLVLDNGCYESTGGQETASGSVRLSALAVAFGYRNTTRMDDLAEVRRSLPALLRQPRGPHLVHLPTQREPVDHVAGRVGIDPAANFRRFRDWLVRESKGTAHAC